MAALYLFLLPASSKAQSYGTWGFTHWTPYPAVWSDYWHQNIYNVGIGQNYTLTESAAGCTYGLRALSANVAELNKI